MPTTEENYKRPLEEIYYSFPAETKKSIDNDIKKIQRYFISWCVYLFFVIFFIFLLVFYKVVDENIGNRLQRAGAIVPLFAIIGEILFLINLNKLASVIHPAKLLVEIYKERRFKGYKVFSYYITFSFFVLGSILSGYGDFLYLWFLDCL